MSSTVPEEWSWHKLEDSLNTRPKSKLLSGESDPRGYYDFYVCSKKILKSFHNEHSSSSVLLSTGGEAAVHLANEHYSFSTDVWATVFDGQVCNEYVFRLLEKNIETINYLGFQGSGIKHLDKHFIEKLEFPVPPLPEQKKIASILTSVDEVIENTQKQIDKLQDLKKATMEELLTHGIGHTEFKDTELGRIPESWEIKSLSEISELSRGKFSHRPRNDPAFYNGRYPFLQTGDIPIDNLEITSFSQSLNEKGLQVSTLFPEGTLVLTIAATIGEIGLLKFDSCFPDSLVGIKVNQAVVRKYFLLLSLRHWKERLILAAPESAQKNLNLDILNPFHVAVPPLNEQKEIESILISIQNHIEVKNNELSKFQSIKKSLMQDLLTGKVQVTVN